MRRGKAEPLKSVDLMHCFEQLHEGAFVVDLRKLMPAVKVYDLAEQRHFFDSALHEHANFPNDLRDASTAFCAAGPRHDAEGAMHVAALHDRDKCSRLEE